MEAHDITFRSWDYLNASGIEQLDFISGGEQAKHAIQVLLTINLVFMYLTIDGIVGYYKK